MDAKDQIPWTRDLLVLPPSTEQKATNHKVNSRKGTGDGAFTRVDHGKHRDFYLNDLGTGISCAATWWFHETHHLPGSASARASAVQPAWLDTLMWLGKMRGVKECRKALVNDR